MPVLHHTHRALLQVPGSGDHEETGQKVNIIPIIAKADTISNIELYKFKIKIMGWIAGQQWGLDLPFPHDDKAVAEINAVMNALCRDGQRRGNESGEQDGLRTAVLTGSGAGGEGESLRLREAAGDAGRVNMEDLPKQTHSRHYDLYGSCKLEEMSFQDSNGDSQPSLCSSLRNSFPLVCKRPTRPRGRSS